MVWRCVSVCSAIVLWFSFASGQQQSRKSADGRVIVPRFVKFGGVLKNDTSKPLTGAVGVTFALYKERDGGAALWLETQNVSADATGRYTVLLGASNAEGLPIELFTSGEARWLGVQVENQPEQRRVLLVAVPYALKAADAETLGGQPASAFVTMQSLSASGTDPTRG